MLKPFQARRLSEALQLAFGAGLTNPSQIKQSIRLGGIWLITCEVPA